MESNRESAKRSRAKKQKHLDDLTAQIAQVSKENNQISISINVATQHYVNLEAENSVLRAQMMELTQRLHSLNEILDFINSSTAVGGGAAAGSCIFGAEGFEYQGFDGHNSFLNNPWNLVGPKQQHRIMTSADMIDYY